MKEQVFKVGDYVKVKNPEAWAVIKELRYAVGKITHIHAGENKWKYCVEFTEDHDGLHTCGQITKPNHGWYFTTKIPKNTTTDKDKYDPPVTTLKKISKQEYLAHLI